MKAQFLLEFGDAYRFALRQTDEPALKAGFVLIRVAAAGLNPIDSKIRRLAPFFAPALPAIQGMDVAGTIVAVGEGVTDFAVGDQVFGCAGGLADMPGSLAEFMLADARLVAKKPVNLSPREAAAMPLCAITAWELVRERARVSSQDHVLVHGGTGGVGHLCVQLARIQGARVTASVSSEEKAALARALGADETVNYRQEEAAAYSARLTSGRGFDKVLDTVGGANLAASFASVRLSGVVACTATRASYDLTPMHEKGLTLHVVFMLIPMIYGQGRKRHGRILAEAATLAEAGRLTPLLDGRRFSLAEAAQAYAHLDSGRAVGKVVVDVAGEKG